MQKFSAENSVQTVHSAPTIRCKDVCFLFCGAVSYPSQSVPGLPSSVSPGHSFQRLLFAPAAGYRHESSGALTNVGTWGLYFASSSYAAGSINAAYLRFESGNVNPLNNANRASGLSVRCVQASARELFFIFPMVRCFKFFVIFAI